MHAMGCFFLSSRLLKKLESRLGHLRQFHDQISYRPKCQEKWCVNRNSFTSANILLKIDKHLIFNTLISYQQVC